MHGLSEDSLYKMAPNKRESKEYSSHKIVERRRRHRINSCISELSHVIPSSFIKARHSNSSGKLEKAEVLELAVAYIHDIKRKAEESKLECTSDETSDNHMDINEDSGAEMEAVSKKRFEDGYKACMKEIAQYLAEVEAMAPQDIRFLRLLCHLQNQNFEEIFTREKKSFKPAVKPIRLLARSTLSRLNGIHRPPTSEKIMTDDTFSDSNSDSPFGSLPKTPTSVDATSPVMSSPRSEGPISSPMATSPMATSPMKTKVEPGDSTTCDLTCHSSANNNNLKIVKVASVTNYSVTQSVVPTLSSSPAVSTVSNSSEETSSHASKPQCSVAMTTALQSSKSESPEERRRPPPPLLPINSTAVTPIPIHGLQTTTNPPHQTLNGNNPAIAATPPQIITFVPHSMPHPAPAKVISGSKLVVDPVSGQYFLLPPTHCIQIPTHVHVTPQGANHIVFNTPAAPGHILAPPQLNHVITTNGHVVSTSPSMPANGVRLLQNQCPNAILAVAPTPTIATTKVSQSSLIDVKSPNDVYMATQENSRYTTCSSYISHNAPLMPGPPLSPTINPIQALENIAKKDPR